MMQGDVKIAIASLRTSKWRSFLTMLGIIIGIVSVVTTVSLGEGVKNEVSKQINSFGKDLVIVKSGAPAEQPLPSLATNNVFSKGNASLSEKDLSVVSQTPGVSAAVPVGAGSGTPEVDGKTLPGSTVIATTDEFATAIGHKVEFGVFFSTGENNREVVVIGKSVAEQLFKENVPIGRTLQLRGQDFIVRGVFEDFGSDTLLPGADLNKAIFIPYNVSKQLADAPVPISDIIVKLEDSKQADAFAQDINHRLFVSHAGQQDFTVLTQAQNLASAQQSVDLITQLVTAVAGIALLVGGIGIMNIMLVSVTERTREIGIRKAIGATNRQILNQFLVEAAVLSFFGGLVGVSVALLVNFGIRIGTNLHPVITVPVIVGATGAAWCIGIIFGVMPAAIAARKDPIEALRYE